MTAAGLRVRDSSVRSDLKALTGMLRSILGRRLTSVLAVGSLGRLAREGAEPVGVEDYDLIAIVAGTAVLTRKLQRLRIDRELRSLTSRLAVPASVGLLPLEALGSLPATLFNYELKYGSLVLWGSDATEVLPAYDAAGLPLVEATKLLINRGVLIWGEVAAHSGLEQITANTPQLGYCCRKVLLALGDAVLIRDGAFQWSYTERARSAARSRGFDEFASSDLKRRYVTALNEKREGTVPRLPTTGPRSDVEELFALHEMVFRSIEQRRLGRGFAGWDEYAATPVAFPSEIRRGFAARYIRLLKCFGPPRGTGFYAKSGRQSDEEALAAAFPILAYAGERDGATVGRLLNWRVNGALTSRDVWARFHAVWARGH